MARRRRKRFWASISPQISTCRARTSGFRGPSRLGTPVYMSPEQCRGASDVDQRSDIYSIGCVMFELLTGRTVFPAQGLGEVLAAHQRLPPPTILSVDRTLPRELDALIQRMLAKRPEDRPQSLEDRGLALLDNLAAAYGRQASWNRQKASMSLTLLLTLLRVSISGSPLVGFRDSRWGRPRKPRGPRVPTMATRAAWQPGSNDAGYRQPGGDKGVGKMPFRPRAAAGRDEPAVDTRGENAARVQRR